MILDCGDCGIMGGNHCYNCCVSYKAMKSEYTVVNYCSKVLHALN